MAIDLFCYCSQPRDEAAHLHLSAKEILWNTYRDRLLVYPPSEVDEVDREIALEHGTEAQTFFLVSINDKAVASQLMNIVDVLNKVFGRENIVVLLNNEKSVN